MGDALLGIDVGGTNIKWIRLTGGGVPLDQGSLPTPQHGPASVVEVIANVRNGLGGSLAGVGVAVPGHVDTATGTTILVPNLAGDWVGYPFGAQLQGRLDIRASVVNDARAFGIAELTLGTAVGVDRAVFAVVGTGLGGAVALRGRILRNDDDSIGEFGHSTVVRDGDLCGCGNRGCAEAYAGVRAMATSYRRSGAPLPAGMTDGRAVVERLRAAFDNGEPQARRVVELATWATGCAISNLCVSLRISTVVVGGGLGLHWPEFAAEIGRQLGERQVLLGPSDVRVSTLGDRAGAIGAAISAAPGQFEYPRGNHDQIGNRFEHRHIAGTQTTEEEFSR